MNPLQEKRLRVVLQLCFCVSIIVLMGIHVPSDWMQAYYLTLPLMVVLFHQSVVLSEGRYWEAFRRKTK